jgi:hypothetical protein
MKHKGQHVNAKLRSIRNIRNATSAAELEDLDDELEYKPVRIKKQPKRKFDD